MIDPGSDHRGVMRSKTLKKRLFALTKRRHQIAMLAARGLSNRAIAEQLSLSKNTVQDHLRKIYQKLNLHRRINLVIDRPINVKRLKALTDRQQQVATLACRGLALATQLLV